MDMFLVQVWIPADDGSRGGDRRGLMRHVATGSESTFLGDQEVLDLLHRRSRPAPADGGPG